MTGHGCQSGGRTNNMTEEKKYFCPSCGAEVRATDKFCRHCGARIDDEPQPEVTEKPAVEEPAVEEPKAEEPAAEPVYEQAAATPEPRPQYTDSSLYQASAPAGGPKKSVIYIAIAAVAVLGLVLFLVLNNSGKNKVFNEAVKYMKDGDYQQAIETLNTIPEHAKSEAYINYCQGLQSLANGYLADAEEYLNKAGNIEDSAKYQSYISGLRKLDEGSDADTFTAAETLFNSAGGVLDSKDLVTYCQAMKAFAGNNDAEASTKLQKVIDSNIGSAYKQKASTVMAYYDAVQKFEAGDDSALEELKSILASNDPIIAGKSSPYKTYAEAMNLFEEKKFFSAYNLFSSIPEVRDAKEKAESCFQSRPKSKIIYNRKKSTQTKLKIVDSKDGLDMFVKIYNKNDVLMETLYIRDGATVTAKLPAGKYRLAIAYGDKGDWFGTKESFGSFGTYERLLLNGSSEYYTFKKNYIYTLKFKVSNGNVGSKGSSYTDL